MKIRNSKSLVFTFISIFAISAIFFVHLPESHAQSAQNWLEPVNLSLSGAASNPSIVVDDQGVIHILWVDKFDGYKYVESIDGMTWTSPDTVEFPFSIKSVPPVFLTDAKGIIHIFWLNDKNKLLYSQTIGENLGAPSAWQSTVELDNFVFDFDVNIDGQRKLHVAYVKNPAPAAGVAGVFYRRSTNVGDSWSGKQLLYESAYFRSLQPENAHIRLATSDQLDDENIYVVWDERSQKRIFMSTSPDGGLKWDVAKEIITPQASTGFRTPFYSDIDVVDNNVLMTWLVGEPGLRCTPFSWVSADGGGAWSEPVKIIGEAARCPEKSEFIHIDPDYAVVLFTIQGDLSISAWDGTSWSKPEIQSGLSLITNPATFDPVFLGCKQALHYNNWLFVVGCDQGGGDVWFIERKLEPMASLFPLPSAWAGDVNVVTVSQSINSLSTVTDSANYIHAVWLQSSSQTNALDSTIEYVRWNGTEWTKAASVITDLTGQPNNLSLQIDAQQRLLISWVNQQTGELSFSWANSERANSPLEWTEPIVILSPSKLMSSPTMLVDSSGRIVIAYAITLNEERGIYLIQSIDVGKTWSPPVKLFDAVLADWEMIDQPRLALTEDGVLHALFTQYRLVGAVPEPIGLYYSQSLDGGSIWTTPELVSEKTVQWSELVTYKKTVYRFWQEKDKSVIAAYHQTINENETTWSPPVKNQGGVNIISTPSVFIDWAGKLHLLQIIQDDTQTLQEMVWSDGRWQMQDARNISLQKQNYPLFLKSGITSQGTIYALLQPQTSLLEDIQTSILYISRSLVPSQAWQPSIAYISTPSLILPTAPPDLQVGLTQVSPLANLDDTRSPIIKNIVGVALIIGVAVFVLILTLPKKGAVKVDRKQPK